MNAAVALAPVTFTVLHGDRRFRVRPAVPGWRQWRALRLVKSPPRRVELTARPRGTKGIPSEWTVRACALERFFEGRGPCPLPAPSKHYQPVRIAWSELPPNLGQALKCVADALTWPRALGDVGTTRLVSLNRRYKQWTRQRATEGDVISEARDFVLFADAAPRSRVLVEPPEPPGEKLDAEALIAAVRHVVARAPEHLRPSLEEAATTEALVGKFEATDSIETRAQRSIWRVESRVRRQNRRLAKNSCPRNGRFESVPLLKVRK